MRKTIQPHFIPGPLCCRAVEQAQNATGLYSLLVWLHLARYSKMRGKLQLQENLSNIARELEIPRNGLRRALKGLELAGLLALPDARKGRFPVIQLLVDPLQPVRQSKQKPATIPEEPPARKARPRTVRLAPASAQLTMFDQLAVMRDFATWAG